MSRISAEDAFLLLAKWSNERAGIYVVMSPAITIGGRRAAAAGTLERVLPHSQKALLTMRDEKDDDVGVTVSLEGAEWEYEDAGAVLPEFADINWAHFLAATFPNGNRYVFGERAAGV
jgi:hypothetical protein